MNSIQGFKSLNYILLASVVALILITAYAGLNLA